MKNLLILTFFICLFSCKQKESKQENKNEPVKEEVTPQDIKEEIVVKLNIELLKNDNIWLFYTEDSEEYSFPTKNVILKSVKGQEGFQTVVFEFPKDVYPERIKFLFGNNKEQESAKLKDIVITRSKNSIKIDSSNFVNFFNLSKYVTTADGTQLYFSVIDGIYDPNIVSSSQLDNELVIL